ADIKLIYDGLELDKALKGYLYNLTKNSSHPLSLSIQKHTGTQPHMEVHEYTEEPGLGISARIDENNIKIGNAEYMGLDNTRTDGRTVVYVATNDYVIGTFEAHQQYRKNLTSLFSNLKKEYKLWMMSGDKDYDRGIIEKYLQDSKNSYFELKPQQKQQKIKELKNTGKTIMIGDGLNDLAAFNESDIALAVWNDESGFTPACDMIVQGKNLNKLNHYLDYMKNERRIVYICFGVSLLYNVVGITFAITGLLSPLIAAVLMPISSFSIIGVSYLYTQFLYNKHLSKI
ncbi:MAG: HAD-IC family P-type ATPase, partial [Bacteroidetes bacterium]|nr:HAD-IC family P-type ATPase [Bacteroidota bacterium]